MLLRMIKNIRQNCSHEARLRRKQAEMERFLSQARDHIHLEYLMEEWDRKNRFMS